jgi:hypothetical protein
MSAVSGSRVITSTLTCRNRIMPLFSKLTTKGGSNFTYTAGSFGAPWVCLSLPSSTWACSSLFLEVMKNTPAPAAPAASTEQRMMMTILDLAGGAAGASPAGASDIADSSQNFGRPQ